MLTRPTIDFYAQLHTGIDVDWCKNQTDRRFYSRAMAANISFPQLFKQRGFDHARIRIKDYDLYSVFEGTGLTLSNEILYRVIECNDARLTPIVAFQAEHWKENPTSELERNQVIEWWQNVTRLLRGYDCAFNILIETTLIGKNNDQWLNLLYKECVAAIQVIDPDRVCIICPSFICAPEKLNDLMIPEGNVFAEAHFYAAGPSPIQESKLWTTGTEAEKDLIRNKVRLMREWSNQTGVPIWLGAIMFGDYNSDGSNDLSCSYSIEEQCTIARFILGELRAAGIPMAINADNKYYNAETQKWIPEMIPLVDSFFN